MWPKTQVVNHYQTRVIECRPSECVIGHGMSTVLRSLGKDSAYYQIHNLFVVRLVCVCAYCVCFVIM